MVVELVLVFVSSLWLMQPSAAAPPMAKPGCKASCGNVTIPYPFGYGAEHCYHEKGFEIICKVFANNTAKPFLSPFDLEVLSISLVDRNVTVKVPVVPICRGIPWTSPNLAGSPFRFSSYNRFTVRGCGNALLYSQSGEIVGGCTATCSSNITTRGCYGIKCCEISIPQGLAIYNITTTDTTTEKCTPSFLRYPDYYPIPAGNFSNIRSTPVLLDWWITSRHNLPFGLSYRVQRCSSFESSVYGMTAYYCDCAAYYEGNPYISNGCQVLPACASCIGSCMGNYSTNYTGNGTYDQYYCYKEKKSLKAMIIGVSTSGGSMFLLLVGFGLYKVIRKVRETRLKKKFFKRNGGLLLQQRMLSNEGVDKLFTSEELQKATDNFNKNRILGQGGQGTVYKGMLTDGRIVAIKKSKLVDEN